MAAEADKYGKVRCSTCAIPEDHPCSLDCAYLAAQPPAPPSRGVALREEEVRIYTTHLLWIDADEDRPEQICDANGQVVLALCRRCGKGESELEDASCVPRAGWVEPVRLLAAQQRCRLAAPPAPAPATAADILDNMAQTFRDRNAVYGSNYKMVAPMVAVLFPNGVPSEVVVTHQWHLFELMLVKMSRFAISELTHVDSIHDAGVYAAMCEAIIVNRENDR